MLPEQDMFIENLHRKCFKKLTIYAASKLRDSDRAQDVVCLLYTSDAADE